MDSVYIVYKTDNWHSYASRDTIGIATSPFAAIEICEEQAKKENKKIEEDQLFNLANLKQTQGYSGECEFQFEEITLNKLI